MREEMGQMKERRKVMTLTEFLLARIAEVEAEARRVLDRSGPWDASPISPERVLAECEAKRRIVAIHAPRRVAAVAAASGENLTREEMLARFHARQGTECPVCFTGRRQSPHCDTLGTLALPYSDHPDYRAEEWRP